MNNEFSAAMKSGFRQLCLRGRAVMGTGMEAELTGADIVSVRISEGSDTGIMPGNVLSAGCTIVLDDSRGQWQSGGEKRGAAPLEGAVFSLELGVFADGNWIYSPMGTFICHDAASDENGAVMTLTCYDSIATKTDADFVDELVYPKSLREVWDNIIAQTGYEWDGPLPNGDIIIDAPPTWGDISVRTAMGYAAQAAGCFVRIGRSGEIEAVPLIRNDAPLAITPGEYLARSRRDNYFGPVNRFKITTVNHREDGDSEPEEIVVAPEASVDSCMIEISANPLFITGAAHTRQLAEAMGEALAGLTYQECRFTWRGDPQLMPGTLIRVTGLDGDVTDCMLSRQTLEFEGGFSAECVCGAPDARGRISAAVSGGVDADRIIGLVPGRNIAADSITARKIAAGAVTADKIVAGSITADKITAGAIVTEKLAAGSVTAEKIAAGAIDTDKLSAGAVTAEKIEAGTITAQQLKAGLITADSGLIAVGAIQTAQIADGSITSAKIVELSADVIKSGTLQTDRLLLVGEGGVVYEINALSSGLSQTELSDEKYRSYINGTVIVANSITAAQIAAGTITANEIAANAITAAKINVADLFASEATISAINAMDIRSNTYLQLYVGDRIDGISVGGRNLWLRTREYDPTKYDGWTSGGAPYTAIDGFGVQRIAGAWKDVSQNVAVDPGAEYTLSAWIKWEDAANTGTLYLYHSGGSIAVTSQVGAQDYARVSATYVETGSSSSCRFECGTDAPYLIYGLKLEKGNKATDWSPAPEDPVSELQAESVVEINKNRVKISTPEFDVDIPTTEGMDVQVNEKGFSAPVISSPTVAKARPGGVYTVGAGGDYACLADAFGDINDCAISEDVWLRMLDGADAGGLLRGVSGAGQVMIAPANLANFSDTAAWTTQNNVNVNVLGSALGVSISASTTGAWKWAYLHVGRVGPLGLRGKTLTLSADMYSNQNAAGLVMQMIVRLNDTAIRYVTRPNVADLTAPATAVASFTISEEAGFWDELNIVFQLNQGTSVPVGAAAFYYNIRMEPGNAVSDAAAGKCTATIGDLRIEGCAAQVNISEIIFPRALEARQSAAALNRCTFKGADGFRLFGGHGYMENCYGSCSATAVYAGGGGAVQITGSAPSGTKAGLLETSGMDAGDPPSGGTPDPEVSKTITAKAKSSGTYDGVNGWWSSDAALRQGYVSGNGRLRGGVWFDLSALPSGATITKLTLRLRRVEGYGKGSAVDVRIYGTTASAKSGDPAASGKISSSYVSGSMEPGKTKTFDVTALKAYTGFVLYAADTAVLSGKSYSTNYARFTGTGGGDDTIPLLTVTYTG